MRRFALSAIGIAVALTGCNRGPTGVVAPPFEPEPLPTPAAAVAAPAAAPAFPCSNCRRNNATTTRSGRP